MGLANERHTAALLIDALRLLPVQPLEERDEWGQARVQAVREGWGEVHAA
jgi:hypothetical protein